MLRWIPSFPSSEAVEWQCMSTRVVVGEVTGVLSFDSLVACSVPCAECRDVNDLQIRGERSVNAGSPDRNPTRACATHAALVATRLEADVVETRRGAGAVELRRGEVGVEVRLDPLRLRVARGGVPLIEDMRFGARGGTGGDRFIQLSEGVIGEEDDMGPFEQPASAELLELSEGIATVAGELEGGRSFELRVSMPGRERVLAELRAADAYRLDATWRPHPAEHLTGLGARHGERFDQTGRQVTLGADRRYTGPDCPPDLLEEGGIPQGDYSPMPWVLSSAGTAVWAQTDGPGLQFDLAEPIAVSQRADAGPLRLHLICDPTPAGRLRRFLRLTGIPPALPEWAYGHWKSRDIYEHQRDVEEDFDGYAQHSLPLDAIVIDSPWETQYNTWRFNPHQFPDPEGMIRRLRAEGVRTVVWVTPWTNLESADGQYPRDAQSESLHRQPASNYSEAAIGGHLVRVPGGDPFVARWWMGTGSPIDFTSVAARRWWKAQARGVLEMGVEGIKADDGEGYYFPPDSRFADGRTGAELAWDYGRLYRETMQEVLDEVHPGAGVVFGRCGWTGQQATGLLWGGDQASDFWSLRTLVAATLTAAASGFSNWSHDVGGYLGKLLVERCPRELLLRWVQFGCFTPLMQAHGRFAQEAWRYDDRTLATYRDYVLLHERLVPYIRAAAATCERSGLPIVRPLCLTDPSDPRGWEIADAYGFGPALWVAPVLEEGALERTVHLPRGEWFDYWTGESISGGSELTAAAPRDRIPVWVRRGSIVVTHPGGHVARGLGDTPEAERPLEATLWGEPAGGRAKARLADGTTVSWMDGEWACSAPKREVRYAERGVELG
jgi:alpha-glucosidase (family GH31 glycosyl hydrolase)